MEIIFSKHAEIEMKKRKIEREFAMKTIKIPQQKFKAVDTWVYQSKYFDKKLKKDMLLRIFAKEDLKGLKIITAYKTTKINKYMAD